MLTIVRAFAWLRWRVLVNSFERTGARDTLAGGGFAMAAIAAVAALTLLVFVMAVTSLVSSLIHLLLRDRRRSDLVMLFLVLGLPLLGALPALFQATGVRDPLRHARQDPPG